MDLTNEDKLKKSNYILLKFIIKILFLIGFNYDNCFDLLKSAIKNIKKIGNKKTIIIAFDDFSSLMLLKGEKGENVKKMFIGASNALASEGDV